MGDEQEIKKLVAGSHPSVKIMLMWLKKNSHRWLKEFPHVIHNMANYSYMVRIPADIKPSSKLNISPKGGQRSLVQLLANIHVFQKKKTKNHRKSGFDSLFNIYIKLNFNFIFHSFKNILKYIHFFINQIIFS